MIAALVTSVVGLASEIAKIVGTMQARKYLDKLVKLKLGIEKEEAKGYHSDDSKIEAMYKELSVIVDAVQLELVAYSKTK